MPIQSDGLEERVIAVYCHIWRKLRRHIFTFNFGMLHLQLT